MRLLRLFASPEAIQKYRKHAKEPHTELREFPAARRYLLNDFYDKVFYGMEEGKRRWGVGMRQGVGSRRTTLEKYQF